MSLSKKIADQWLRKQATPAMLRVVMQELEVLQELSDNLTEIEDQVHQTFKMAKVMDPKVRSQFDALKKAREGLKHAESTKGAIAVILTHYPEDKTALRAFKDAAVLIKRFQKHETEAQKIITRISKKEMPPALKKMSASLARMLQARLTNPKDLRVTWWQEETKDYSTRQEGVLYLTLFRVPGEDSGRLTGVGLMESTLRPGVFSVSVGNGSYHAYLNSSAKPTTAKAEVATFLEALKGSPLIKGEGDRTKNRVEAAKELFDEIKYRWDRAYRGDYSNSEMDPKGRSMEFENRAIPHDTYAGYNEVQEGLDAEIDTISQWLKPLLQKHKGLVKNHSFDAGEKGYMTLYVELK